MKSRTATLILFVAMFAAGPAVEASAQSARTLYTRALARERTLRDGSRKPSLSQLRNAVAAYEALARRYPGSGYTDNALWQGANLSLVAYDRFGQDSDMKTGIRLLTQLRVQHPSSSLSVQARDLMRQRDAMPAAMPPAVAIVPPPPVLSSRALPLDPPAAVPPLPRPSAIAIRDVKRTALPDGIRVSIELDAESTYHAERLENPRRVFFDIKGARPSAALQDSSLKFPDDIVREIRLGRHPNATRIVMDMEGAESYSVFTLYDPFRLIVDFKRAASPPPVAAPPPALPAATRQTPAQDADSAALPDAKPIPSRPITAVPPPALPNANLDGKFSIARQLGLGISRIVIDAGHGGHDPGAMSNGISESELTLDVALRLSRLLENQPGVDVVMTRSTDVFIPLEERTAIANREGADLFLSVHANASRNSKARGVETYFLNFATNPDAEAVAARENAGSAQSMNRLPAIVKAIALNNKREESKDFAEAVQRSMVRRLGAKNKDMRDLGVKQAPFVVLIGAAMPSVLAEIAFVTNKQEGALVKTGPYRQQIAEALFDAVVRYQQSLKKMRPSTTARSTTR
jgi:N-acetylmuramoyl-L-alanine amidase